MNQVLEGNIRGALFTIDFIYREDGIDVVYDLKTYPSVDQDRRLSGYICVELPECSAHHGTY